MISFIVPLNNRKIDRIDGLYHNIYKYYGEPGKLNYEIVFINQDQREPFKLGQNRNLGFKKSKGEIIVFLDIDIRFKSKINFEDILEKSKNKPVVCWEFIIQVEEDNYYNLLELGDKKKGVGKGGCILFRREDFIKSCGNSNLILGWGKEDDILAYRSNMIRLLGMEIYHVFHKDKRELWGLKKEFLGKALDRNTKIVNMVRDGIIDKEKDGFNQTIADIRLCEEQFNGFISYYNVSNIRVQNDFEYLNLYNEINSIIL